MIQRAQTIYLLFSVLLCMFTFYLFPLEFEKKGVLWNRLSIPISKIFFSFDFFI